MRSIVLTTMTLIACFSLPSTAATMKVSWTGVVPSLDCASRPISNQTDFETLNNQCQSEFKIELQPADSQTKVEKNIVSFDV